MKPVLVWSLALLVIGSLPAAETTQLETVLERIAKKVPAGGIVAAEFNRDNVHFVARGDFGVAGSVAPERVIFEIGSISKVFTALLLAETVQEGKASLDDPIAKHLPADLNLPPEIAAITLEQLSSHTSGLPRLPPNFAPKDPKDPYADFGISELHAALKASKLTGPAPQPPAYSNFGQGLLGHLLSRVHQRTYEQLVNERIATPLGLKDTVITLTAEQRTRLAAPHSGAESASAWQFDALAGAGAIRSTAADLTTLAQALMKPADTPLSRAWELVRQPRAETGDTKFGLAVTIAKVDGVTTYSHAGGTGGYRTHLEFAVEGNRGLVVLINNDALEPMSVPIALREARLPASKNSPREETPIAVEKLPEFTGVYELSPQARFTLMIGDDSRLIARLSGQPFFPLFHSGNDRFFYRVVPAEIQFVRNADGKIISLTLFQNGRELSARRSDQAVPTILFPTEAELAAYAGSFEFSPGLVLKVSSRGRQLFAQLTGQPQLPVFKQRDDYYASDVVEAALGFERDAEGKVIAAVLHQNGVEQRATRIP